MHADVGLDEQRPHKLFSTCSSLEVRFARGLTLQRGARSHPTAACRGGAEPRCPGVQRLMGRQERQDTGSQGLPTEEERGWLTPPWDAPPMSGDVLQHLPPVMTPDVDLGGGIQKPQGSEVQSGSMWTPQIMT